MRGAVVILALVFALAPPAVAQPAPCAPCAQGNVLIDRYKIEAVRPLARDLAALRLDQPASTAQYATIVDLRKRWPTLSRLGALDDTELALVAAALCQEPDSNCTASTVRALTCLAERCEVALPAPDPKRVDVTSPIAECRRYSSRKRSPPIGLGLEWGTGYDRSRYANDGRAWSLGIEGRLALGRRRGLVVRADRSAGRDETTDADADGHDDMSSGSITRFSALAGPSFVLDAKSFDRSTRFLRVDFLAGYLATLSQPGEDGFVAGADVSYQVSGIRVGTRFIQGIGDTRSATMVLAHLGISVGNVPPHDEDDECSRTVRQRNSRLAIGFEIPLGYGFSSHLGFVSGFGMELLWYLSRRVDAATHVDILIYPGEERDRVIHQAVLAGLRVDLGTPKRRRERTGFHTTLMGGYSLGSGFSPTTAGSGPVLDAAIGWGIQDRDTAGWLRLHTRVGIGSGVANDDYVALFLSAGFELRFDPHYWRKRVRQSY